LSDDPSGNRARRQRPTAADAVSLSSTPPGAPDDPEAALRRLESLGTTGGAAGPPSAAAGAPPLDVGPPPAAGLPPAPAVDVFSAPPPRSQPAMGSPRRQVPAARPRLAGSRTSRLAARIVAPIAFLVAVIALVGIVVGSGVMNGSTTPTPTPTATRTKAVGVTKKYVIRSGDSLTSIAARFHTSVAELMQLNPGLTGSTTLVVGARIVVPRQ
jgi:LysM repeat protein